MLFCVDIGNTNIVLGVSDDEKVVEYWRIRTDKRTTEDELAILVSSLLDSADIKTDDISDVIISCVVPPLLNTFEKYCRRYLGLVPMIVGPELDVGMPIRYENRKEVGADRIVNSVAAYEKYGSALIVVDFGTATTFDFVSGRGEYMGGAIAPGISISCEALFQSASKLPRVDFSTPPKEVIAKETSRSMAAGIVFGYAGLVDGIVERMKKESGDSPRVIATGGLASVICGVSNTIELVEENLTLNGLMIIFNRNK